MNRQEGRIKYAAFVIGLAPAIAAIAVGQEPCVDADRGAYAKGPVVLRLSFPSQGEVKDVSVLFSTDGDTFENTRAGLPRNWQLFTSVGDDGETTTALILLVGRFDMGKKSFLFDEPGTYHFRWGVGFKDEGVDGFNARQIVEVGPAREADLAFLDRLADPDLLRYLFGDDFFDRQTETVRERMLAPSGADMRALKVIARLLQATRATSASNVFLDHKLPKEEDKRRWGDTLSELAEAIPESSYAPYAAYYAGCCYSMIGLIQVAEGIQANQVPGQPKDRAAETELRFSLTKKNTDCARACKAFGFAARRGDDYLKPRALFQQAVLRASSGALDEVEQLLSKAEQIVPGEKTIQKMSGKLRKRVCKFKESRAQQKESTGGN